MSKRRGDLRGVEQRAALLEADLRVLRDQRDAALEAGVHIAERAGRARRELAAATAAFGLVRANLECAERRAGHYAAQAIMAQVQLNQVPGWVLWCVGAWRDARALGASGVSWARTMVRVLFGG
jgi:hypothetical protein